MHSPSPSPTAGPQKACTSAYRRRGDGESRLEGGMGGLAVSVGCGEWSYSMECFIVKFKEQFLRYAVSANYSL